MNPKSFSALRQALAFLEPIRCVKLLPAHADIATAISAARAALYRAERLESERLRKDRVKIAFTRRNTDPAKRKVRKR